MGKLRRRSSNQDLIKQAQAELKQKTHAMIEQETAYKWGSRAIAAYLFSQETRVVKEKISWLSDAEDYFKEAVEHAATSLNSKLVIKITKWIKPYRITAQNDFLKCRR